VFRDLKSLLKILKVCNEILFLFLSLFNIQNSIASITKKYQKAAFLIRFVKSSIKNFFRICEEQSFIFSQCPQVWTTFSHVIRQTLSPAAA